MEKDPEGASQIWSQEKLGVFGRGELLASTLYSKTSTGWQHDSARITTWITKG